MEEMFDYSKLTLEQISYLLDSLMSNAYRPMLIQELKKHLQLNKDIIESYPLSEDRYLCFREKDNIEMIESILKVIDNETNSKWGIARIS